MMGVLSKKVGICGVWCWEWCIMLRILGVGVKSYKVDGMRFCDGFNMFL